MMILGIHQKAPNLQEIFVHNAVGWLGTKAQLVRFEDIKHHLADLDSGAAETYFADLLGKCGIEALPDQSSVTSHVLLRGQSKREPCDCVAVISQRR